MTWYLTGQEIPEINDPSTSSVSFRGYCSFPGAHSKDGICNIPQETASCQVGRWTNSGTCPESRRSLRSGRWLSTLSTSGQRLTPKYSPSPFSFRPGMRTELESHGEPFLGSGFGTCHPPYLSWGFKVWVTRYFSSRADSSPLTLLIFLPNIWQGRKTPWLHKASHDSRTAAPCGQLLAPKGERSGQPAANE